MEHGLLHEVVLHGDIEFVQKLVSSGANVNEKASDGLTPLHSAAGKGVVEIAKVLISAGANVNATSLKGNSPLHQAIGGSRLEMVRYLVSAGADVNAEGEDGWAPLHWAAQEDSNVEIAEFLVSKGAKVNARNDRGNTPLGLAAQYGNAAMARYLTGAGGYTHSETRPDVLSALREKAESGDVEAMLKLVGKLGFAYGRDGNEDYNTEANYWIEKARTLAARRPSLSWRAYTRMKETMW